MHAVISEIDIGEDMPRATVPAPAIAGKSATKNRDVRC
jgi:hypothetical protein